MFPPRTQIPERGLYAYTRRQSRSHGGIILEICGGQHSWKAQGEESVQTLSSKQESSGNGEDRGARLLELDGLGVKYGPIEAVKDFSLQVGAGEIVTLLGTNGAGKSSTLNAIVGLAPKSGGRVLFDGQDITSAQTDKIVKKGITLVPEGRRVFSDLTVEENLRLGGATRNRHDFEVMLPEIFDLFPVLKSRRVSLAGLLSGGEQQQLAIGRALFSHPKILLLDEPSLGLAPIVVANVFETIEKLRDRGVTILLVEQNVERALAIADRGYVLASGRLEMSGSTESLSAAEIEEAYLGIKTGGAS
jgi:branched-chain amino acid transport system ATP-binding protein